MIPNPMPWSIILHDRPRYGDNCWTIVLPDGREAVCYAHRVTVDDGVLTLWADERLRGSALNVLAPGAWLHCYATSALNGDPLGVESVEDSP